jgi:NAD(P)-dependent dehydrogenase (short-subunit alcohol dehydrogenase family)
MVDLAVAGSAEAAVAACLQAFGRIDILINNAGVRRRKTFGDFTHQDFQDVVAVYVRAPFFGCQAVLPAMNARGRGRIVNVGSQLGSVATAEHALYGMTKAALIYLTKAIALESTASGAVNCVSPITLRITFDVRVGPVPAAAVLSFRKSKDGSVTGPTIMIPLVCVRT